MIRSAALLVAFVLACGHGEATKVGQGGFPATSHHIAARDDVRWPLERRSFVGIVRTAGERMILELADGSQVGTPVPALVVLDGPARLAPGERVHVSGIGRVLTDAEQAAGAMLSLADVQVEPDDAAPARDGDPSTWRGLRTRIEIVQAVQSTRVTAEGLLIERPSANGSEFLLEVGPQRYLRVVVVVEGVHDIRARAGKRVRAEGWMMVARDDDWPRTADIVPGLALLQPMFIVGDRYAESRCSCR